MQVFVVQSLSHVWLCNSMNASIIVIIKDRVLMCCWILIASILLRIFASMFISDIGL